MPHTYGGDNLVGQGVEEVLAVLPEHGGVHLSRFEGVGQGFQVLMCGPQRVICAAIVTYQGLDHLNHFLQMATELHVEVRLGRVRPGTLVPGGDLC